MTARSWLPEPFAGLSSPHHQVDPNVLEYSLIECLQLSSREVSTTPIAQQHVGEDENDEESANRPQNGYD